MSFSKFKLGAERRPAKKNDYSKKIKQMSLSLLQEMDRKYDSSHFAKPNQSVDLSKAPPQKRPRLLENQRSQLLMPPHYDTTTSKQLTQSNTDLSRGTYSTQMKRQQSKLTQIQNGYQRFQQSNQMSVDKENVPPNQDSFHYKDDLNHILSSLEKQFLPDSHSTPLHSYPHLIHKHNKSPIDAHKKSKDETKLREIIHGLQQKDACQRLDIAKLKKQNQDLKKEIAEYQN